MKSSDLISALIEVHNIIAKTTVSGDNAIYIGNALQSMRALIQAVNNEGVKDDSPDKDDAIEKG